MVNELSKSVASLLDKNNGMSWKISKNQNLQILSISGSLEQKASQIQQSTVDEFYVGYSSSTYD
jgi:hypothetical protein